MRWLALIALWCCALVAAVSAAEARTQRVQFAPGATSAVLNGSIRGEETVDYTLGAAAGQRLTVTLSTNNASSAFNVTAPGAGAAMFVGTTSGNRFETVLPATGDYRISVYLTRSAARRNEVAIYTLTVSVIGGGGRPPPPPPPDFGGGPDYWQVAGLSPGDTLNVRSAPDAKASVVGRLAMGQIVRNLGCRMSGSQRWCQVEVPQARTEGWANAQYLREATYPAPRPPPGPRPPPPRPPPGPSYGPTTVKCSDTPQQCFTQAALVCGGGSYQVIDSESHAGGVADDRVPGPVTWYGMTFVCGRSNGTMPTFPWRGPEYRPPAPRPPTVKVKDMQRYCQGEAAAKFRQPPQEIVTYPVVAKPNGGHAVQGQYPPRGKRVTTFTCHFDASGAFKRVDKD